MKPHFPTYYEIAELIATLNAERNSPLFWASYAKIVIQTLQRMGVEEHRIRRHYSCSKHEDLIEGLTHHFKTRVQIAENFLQPKSTPTDDQK